MEFVKLLLQIVIAITVSMVVVFSGTIVGVWALFKIFGQ